MHPDNYQYRFFIINMEIITTVGQLSERLASLHAQSRTIGLVPTMGALHAGHMSLIERARRENDIVVVSVFVNPTQFNNPEDLRTYPRTEEADCALLRQADVDFAFVPTVSEMYPQEDNRQFDLGPVAQVMEGAMRPGHFNGVAQIVSKLFAIVNPTRAYFGEKDFQQIAVIRKMVQLEGFSLEIVACPIKREEDGLAMSSRNVRLTPEHRAVAPQIHKILTRSVDMKSEGASVVDVKAYVVDAINALEGLEVEYYEIVDALSMQPVGAWDEAAAGAVGCVTVYAGDVRLIDNIKY